MGKNRGSYIKEKIEILTDSFVGCLNRKAYALKGLFLYCSG